MSSTTAWKVADTTRANSGSEPFESFGSFRSHPGEPTREPGRLLLGAAGVHGVTMLMPNAFHLFLAGYLFVYARVHFPHG